MSLPWQEAQDRGGVRCAIMSPVQIGSQGHPPPVSQRAQDGGSHDGHPAWHEGKVRAPNDRHFEVRAMPWSAELCDLHPKLNKNLAKLNAEVEIRRRLPKVMGGGQGISGERFELFTQDVSYTVSHAFDSTLPRALHQFGRCAGSTPSVQVRLQMQGFGLEAIAELPLKCEA